MIYAPLKKQLERLSHADIKTLSDMSGVPFATIIKIKYGETQNPGVLTVEALVKSIESVRRIAA